MAKKQPSSAPSAHRNGQESEILVGILMGSASDYPIVEESEKALQQFGIPFETTVASAHRTPDLVRQFVRKCEERGAQVFIAAAGGAAALPGVVAAETTKPVIGIPIASALNGIDSLLSIAQMPGGVPVAAMAIGEGGAKNAGLLAVQILALSSARISEAYKNYKLEQRNKVIDDAKKLKTNPQHT